MHSFLGPSGPFLNMVLDSAVARDQITNPLFQSFQEHIRRFKSTLLRRALERIFKDSKRATLRRTLKGFKKDQNQLPASGEVSSRATYAC